jgi:phage major head subunit gpT-like protein
MATASKFDHISDKEVVGLFFQAMSETADRSWVSSLATTFTSSSASEKYAGVGNPPALREWIGERKVKNLREHTVTVVNNDYEATLQMFLKDLRRDKTGQLEMKVRALAERAAEHDEKILSALIIAGEASNAYSGHPFFDTDHTVGDSGALDNDKAIDISALPTGDTTGSHGSTTSPSVGEAALVIQAGIQALFAMKDDEGEPVNQNMQEVMVMVPTSLMAPFEAALTTQTMAQGMSNPLWGSSIRKRLVVNPRLTWTENVAVFRTDGAIKPFIVQIEEPPVMEVVGAGSEYEFLNNGRLYGVKKSGNVAYWDFTKACLLHMD